MVEYDSYYLEENYFGKPLDALMQFFHNQEQKGKVLDLGCGQGRDSIPLAEMGYEVTGIDISEIGVHQMMDIARRKNLALRGIVSDIYSYDFDLDYDFVLLDSMLHFEENDKQKEIDFLIRIGSQMKVGGIVCICIWESDENQKLVKNIFEKHQDKWDISVKNQIDYVFPGQSKQKFKYSMIVVKKLSD